MPTLAIRGEPPEPAERPGARRSPDGDTRPGQVVGAYRLLSLLGEGAIGRVFLAEHVRLGRKVALKLLRPEHTSNPRLLARFFAEARAVNLIAHENIVAITDFFEEERGRSCFVMELLEGETLGARLARKGALTLAEVLHVARQLASALEAAHAAGVVHRDLKPENIFLTARGGDPSFVKVLDFGVAKLSDPADGARTIGTAVGTILGTPLYMAPEQTIGAAIDGRADVYALGVLLYELSTGTNPFAGGSTDEVINRHQTWTPPRPALGPSRTGAAVADLIMECLAKRPRDRPNGMRELGDRLGVIERARGAPVRWPIAAGAVAVVLLFAGWAIARARPEVGASSTPDRRTAPATEVVRAATVAAEARGTVPGEPARDQAPAAAPGEVLAGPGLVASEPEREEPVVEGRRAERRVRRAPPAPGRARRPSASARDGGAQGAVPELTPRLGSGAPDEPGRRPIDPTEVKNPFEGR